MVSMYWRKNMVKLVYYCNELQFVILHDGTQLKPENDMERAYLEEKYA